MSKRSWLEISEYICLGLSVLGTIAATVTQQVVYAAVPLSLSMALNLANRPRFNYSQPQQQIEQLQSSLQNMTDNFYQVKETMDTSNQRLQQIEAWRQQLIQIIDKKIEISIQELTANSNQFNQQIQEVNNRLTGLDNSLQNLNQAIHQQGEELITVQELKSEFSQFNQQIEFMSSRFEQIENSIKNWSESSQQQLAELRQNQENQGL